MEVTAERAFLSAMGGGCRAPFAAHASWSRGELAVEAAALHPDGEAILRDRLVGRDEDADAIGRRLAGRLLERGAEALATIPEA
jgi:hydroxymethylbilane synthase